MIWKLERFFLSLFGLGPEFGANLKARPEAPLTAQPNSHRRRSSPTVGHAPMQRRESNPLSPDLTR
jgi:hypothetical protein